MAKLSTITWNPKFFFNQNLNKLEGEILAYYLKRLIIEFINQIQCPCGTYNHAITVEKYQTTFICENYHELTYNNGNELLYTLVCNLNKPNLQNKSKEVPNEYYIKCPICRDYSILFGFDKQYNHYHCSSQSHGIYARGFNLSKASIKSLQEK